TRQAVELRDPPWADFTPSRRTRRLRDDSFCSQLPRLERSFEDLPLLDHVRLVRAGRRARALDARNTLEFHIAALGQDRLDARRDEEPRSHVGRLVLHPEALPQLRVRSHRVRDELWPPRIELLEAHDRDGVVLAPAALLEELVIDLAAAHQNARDLLG